MKILITGGSGLVGYGLKQIISNDNPNEFIFLSSKDCDLTNLEQTQKMFQNIKPDYVIHLAAFVGGLFRNMNYKVDMYEKNTVMNYNVLKCCHDFKVEKVISCLSTCIFPDKTYYPINEDMLHDGPPHNSNDAYAYAKRMLEIHCKAYRENFNKDFICVIPTNIYGEYDNFDPKSAMVIPSLIRKGYECNSISVWGDGSQIRDFIYAGDVARAMLHLVERKVVEPINIGSGSRTTIKEIANLVASEFGKILFGIRKKLWVMM